MLIIVMLMITCLSAWLLSKILFEHLKFMHGTQTIFLIASGDQQYFLNWF